MRFDLRVSLLFQFFLSSFFSRNSGVKFEKNLSRIGKIVKSGPALERKSRNARPFRLLDLRLLNFSIMRETR